MFYVECRENSVIVCVLGKTRVMNCLISMCLRDGIAIKAVASSGIAGMVLCCGTTAHSCFKIPIGSVGDDVFCGIGKQSKLAAEIKEMKVLFWDEVTMTHKDVVNCVDRSLRDIRSNEAAFGGVVVVFGGDFRQVNWCVCV